MPLPAPRALLLDFGGVIADGPDHPDWGTAMAAAIGEVLAEAGVAPISPEEIVESLATDGRGGGRAVLARRGARPARLRLVLG